MWIRSYCGIKHAFGRYDVFWIELLLRPWLAQVVQEYTLDSEGSSCRIALIVEGARVSGYNQNVQLVSSCWVAVTQNAVTVTLMVVSAKMTESGTCTCQGLLKTFSRVLLAHKTRFHPHLTSSCPALLQEHGHDKPDPFVPFLKSSVCASHAT